MYSSLLLLSLVPFAANSSPADSPPGDLFGKLDRSSDGLITRDEINDTQLPLFQRALRVADRNEDGALSPDELKLAISDPKPVELPGANVADRMRGFDVKRLDRNSDGEITLEEVPEPMKERFEQLLDRLNLTSVPTDRLEAYMRGERPSESDSKQSDSKQSDSSESMKPDAMEKMDTPKVEHRRTQGQPDPKGKKGPAPGSNVSNAVFEQLDKDSNGKLSADEIPRRMQQNFKSADANKDGSITQKEFDEAMRRRKDSGK